MLKINIVTICLLYSVVSFSQDIQFSQFYNVPLYQNPAFAGSAHQPRFGFHNRLQWPALDARYMTTMFSFDTYSSKYQSGIGGYFFRDWQSGTNVTTTSAAFQYAYEVRLSKSLTFRPGLQISYVGTSLGNGLTVPENFTKTGQISDAPNNSTGIKRYADISTGGLIYTDKAWFGFAADHINTPNTSYIGRVGDLPAKFSFTAGYKIILNKDPYYNKHSMRADESICIIPTAHYKFQGTSDQLDLGAYGMYQALILGVWYRGLPIKNYSKEYINNESVIFSVGYKLNPVTITYSYDYTISHLMRVGTGGAHELNITYTYKKSKRPKIMKRLPCPTFD